MNLDFYPLTREFNKYRNLQVLKGTRKKKFLFQRFIPAVVQKRHQSDKFFTFGRTKRSQKKFVLALFIGNISTGSCESEKIKK